MKIIVGVDPGKTGAVTVLKPSGALTINKMPTTPKDIYLLFKSIKVSHKDQQIVVYLEGIFATRVVGSSRALNFGKNHGHLEMAILVLGFEYKDVRPQDWQKELGCLSSGDKNITKRKAQALFPELHLTHDTADSILIARYGQIKEKVI